MNHTNVTPHSYDQLLQAYLSGTSTRSDERILLNTLLKGTNHLVCALQEKVKK